MIATAGKISREPGHWWADRLNNTTGRMATRVLATRFGNKRLAQSTRWSMPSALRIRCMA